MAPANGDAFGKQSEVNEGFRGRTYFAQCLLYLIKLYPILPCSSGFQQFWPLDRTNGLFVDLQIFHRSPVPGEICSHAVLSEALQ